MQIVTLSCNLACNRKHVLRFLNLQRLLLKFCYLRNCATGFKSIFQYSILVLFYNVIVKIVLLNQSHLGPILSSNLPSSGSSNSCGKSSGWAQGQWFILLLSSTSQYLEACYLSSGSCLLESWLVVSIDSIFHTLIELPF